MYRMSNQENQEIVDALNELLQETMAAEQVGPTLHVLLSVRLKSPLFSYRRTLYAAARSWHVCRGSSEASAKTPSSELRLNK